MAVLSTDDVIKNVNTAKYMQMSLFDWRVMLSEECQVYVCKDSYLAKRFDQINYQTCGVKEATEILKDNLFALLRYKYFPRATDEVEQKIQDIVKAFTVNIKTTLIRVDFAKNTDAIRVYDLEDSQVAFRNGVFDFKTNDWLFKYEIITLPDLFNKIYVYDKKYIIHWYFDFDFEPLPIDITQTNLHDFIDIMKDFDKDNKNYCFELLWNMSHDENHKFDFKRFQHMSEVLGYTILQSFSEYFILLIGAGQNGKNSLFDGCFSHAIVPRPAANSLDDIEQDRFIAGSLENKSHNIFLETSAKTYTESKNIKALTGSLFQTVEHKGVDKYSAMINCKYIFAGNDQEKIKFTDTTNGFRRRINILEIFYEWDREKRFLKKNKDYYDVSFSDSLKELKDDVLNTIAYIYFAMYGIYAATKGFSKNFEFSYNDWKLSYSNIDFDLKDSLENLTISDIEKYIRASATNYEACKNLFYDIDGKVLSNSETTKKLGYFNYQHLVDRLFKNEDEYISYFSEYDVYMNIGILRNIVKYVGSAVSFSAAIKKIYNLNELKRLANNQAFIKVSFINGKMKVIKT